MNVVRLVLAVLMPLLVANAMLWWPIHVLAAIGWAALLPVSWWAMQRAAP